jgi:protein-ribulosamine 3-kinase
MSLWDYIAQQISAQTGAPFQVTSRTSVGGGCINQAYCLSDDKRRYFVKTNSAARLDMFEAEFAGLKEIHDSTTIGVPQPVCTGKDASTAFLVLEYMPLGGSGGRDSIERLGQQLAAMHQSTQAQYGWKRDNTIGSTPQINDYGDDWSGFWRDRRLGYQLELAARHGHGGHLQRQGEKLLDRIDAFFQERRPQASLLHGDLWSGNYGFIDSGSMKNAGQPVIFDPAVYFGDRETDLAMTELFGGFPARFYDAYNEAYPLDAGYSVRKTLYNLYHILNHLNLFGGGYLGQAERMIEVLISET